MSPTHRIAVLLGDGIGTDVVPDGLCVLDAAAEAFDLALSYEHFEFSSADYYTPHGRMLSEDWFEQLHQFDAIYFGAVRWPEVVPDPVSLGAACCSSTTTSTSTSISDRSSSCPAGAVRDTRNALRTHTPGRIQWCPPVA